MHLAGSHGTAAARSSPCKPAPSICCPNQHAALHRGGARNPPDLSCHTSHPALLAVNSLDNLSSTLSAPPLLDQAGPSSSGMAGPSSSSGNGISDVCVVCLDNPRQTVLVSLLQLCVEASSLAGAFVTQQSLPIAGLYDATPGSYFRTHGAGTCAAHVHGEKMCAT